MEQKQLNLWNQKQNSQGNSNGIRRNWAGAKNWKEGIEKFWETKEMEGKAEQREREL